MKEYIKQFYTEGFATTFYQKPIKFITFGFNSKSTITISSVRDNKIIVCLQRDVQKMLKQDICHR